MSKLKILFIYIIILCVQIPLNSMSRPRPHRFSFSQITLPQIQLMFGNPEINVYAGALFCEIKNFQEIYAQNDIVSISGFLKYYFDRASNYVKMFGGSINKFYGASFFAVFPRSSDINDSVLCNELMSCIFALIGLEEELAQRGIVNIELAIGATFGFAASGTIGDGRFHEDTYVGDTINVASRLQKACFKLDQNVLVSQKIFKNLGQKYKSVLLHMSFQSLKGREKKTCCYGYKCLKDDKTGYQGSFSDSRIYRQYFFNSLSSSYHDELSRIVIHKYVMVCCDVRNFTTYCERDPDKPDAILRFLNNYYADLTQIVSKYRGIVYKFLGDGILVVFPIESPLELPQVCDMALKCGCEFVNVAQKFKVENGVGMDVDDFFPLTVGLGDCSQWNSLCNDILLCPSLKRVFDLESVNKNPYVHSVASKHIVVSNAFYNSMSEENRSCFGCANSYLFNKKTPIWVYMNDEDQALPAIRSVKRTTVNIAPEKNNIFGKFALVTKNNIKKSKQN